MPRPRILASDLRRFLDGEPILGRRPGPMERLGRSLRRREFLWLAAGAVVTAAAVLTLALIHGSRVSPPAEIEPLAVAPMASLPADLALVPPEAIGFIFLDLAALREVRPPRDCANRPPRNWARRSNRSSGWESSPPKSIGS